MNKKINTVLFVLGASILNILLMLLLIVLGLALVGTVAGDSMSEGAASMMFLGVFVFAIAGAFFIYHRLVRFISKKIDMDKYFHPIFSRRGK